jgi:hypothetical protein
LYTELAAGSSLTVGSAGWLSLGDAGIALPAFRATLPP